MTVWGQRKAMEGKHVFIPTEGQQIVPGGYLTPDFGKVLIRRKVGMRFVSDMFEVIRAPLSVV